MREKVANEIMMRLSGKIPDDELLIIRNAIMSVLSGYEVSERETSVALYESFVPRFYEVYLATLRVNGRSLSTVKTYNYHLVNFFLQLHRPITEVTSADIYRYLCQLQDRGTISNRTLDHVRIIINTFLQWCVDEEYIQRNPCRTIKPIKYSVRERVPLTDIELESARDACVYIRESAIFETLYSTGCRVSELIRLTKEDVSLDNRTVVLFGKGNKYRTSFLNARAELVLRKYLHQRKEDCPSLIVTNRKPCRPMSKESIEKIIRTIGERAKLERNLTPHVLRHTFATNLLRRGASLEDVQRLLGHTDPSTTLIYAKIDTSALRYDHERYII